MKARRKQRTATRKLTRRLARLEKAQNYLVRDVLHAVHHVLTEFASSGSDGSDLQLPDRPKRKRER